MKVKKIIFILYMCFTCLFLVGCGDNVDIDKRAFVSTIAIDIGKDVDKFKNLKSIVEQNKAVEENVQILDVTYGFPDVRNMDPEKGAAPEIPITASGYSMANAYFNAATKTSREFHLGHTKLLLLNEDILKYPDILSGIVDYIERDSILNRSMYIAIVKGKARDYINYKPTTEENIENYTEGLMNNISRNSGMVPVTLHNYLSNLSKESNLIPYIGLENENKDFKVYGMTSIKNFKLNGFLNNVEMSNIGLIKGDIGTVQKVVFLDNHPIDYYTNSSESKLRVKYEDKLILNYHIMTEGKIMGAYMNANMLDDTKVKEVEKQLNALMEKEFTETFLKVQKDLKIDPLEVKEHLMRYRPKLWKNVKDNWNEVYENAEVHFKVENKIRNVGVAN